MVIINVAFSVTTPRELVGYFLKSRLVSTIFSKPTRPGLSLNPPIIIPLMPGRRSLNSYDTCVTLLNPKPIELCTPQLDNHDHKNDILEGEAY